VGTRLTPWTAPPAGGDCAAGNGTGYSSLTYLRALPVDEIKLDRSFVTSLTRDPRASAIVRSTQQLSRDLAMTFVVEGVEDAATLEVLRGFGCDVAQGWHVARPMPAARFLAWLQQHPVRRAGLPARSGG
jgi:EAL domain-containing protein (putative c-di-GMP-specific phosphodiesterase class I)